MIVCPNCDHQNPDGAAQCEACYTPLPVMSYCPNCGSSVQSNSTFCGQCGYSLQPQENSVVEQMPQTMISRLHSGSQSENLSPTQPPTPAVNVESLSSPIQSIPSNPPAMTTSLPKTSDDTALDDESFGGIGVTRLQIQTASLLHLQTNKKLEVPQGLSVIHVGKPNEQIPPDLDVSGFPDSDIVSRIHADIRVEGDIYYIEDTGSSNGTYVNHVPLSPGDRHRLRPGDRIALGKGDKITFIFQLS